MAPAANSKKVFMALAILLVTGAAKEDGCIRRVDDESLPAGSCLCYDKCSGPDEEGLRDVYSQACFVDCVLRHGCICPHDEAEGGDGDGGEGGGGAETEADTDNDDGAPPPSPLPATLDKVLRMNVTRPKVLRSREEKRRAEEALLIKVDVEGSSSKFEVRVNDHYLDDLFPSPGEGITNVIPLSSFLEKEIRADGDKTIVVSLVPWVQGNRVIVRDVRIVYQDK